MPQAAQRRKSIGRDSEQAVDPERSQPRDTRDLCQGVVPEPGAVGHVEVLQGGEGAESLPEALPREVAARPQAEALQGGRGGARSRHTPLHGWATSEIEASQGGQSEGLKGLLLEGKAPPERQISQTRRCNGERRAHDPLGEAGDAERRQQRQVGEDVAQGAVCDAVRQVEGAERRDEFGELGAEDGGGRCAQVEQEFGFSSVAQRPV